MMKNPLDAYDLNECIIAEPMALSLHWKDGKVVELRARWASSVTESETLTDEATHLKDALERYVAGDEPNWPDLPYDFSRLTEFHTAVLKTLYTIPSGTMCTYGELAIMIGNPKAARAIGKAMATNPFPIVYPCHRVIGSTGEMTGFSAEGGIDMKEFLLKHEGALKAPPQRETGYAPFVANHSRQKKPGEPCGSPGLISSD